MNIKIYFNNKFIAFEENAIHDPTNQPFKTYENLNQHEFEKIIFKFLQSPDPDCIKIVSNNGLKAVERLKSLFYYIEAAGGFIEKNRKFLFIHRFGRWDLPKGKLEKNETIENAAIRECEEECAIKGLKIIRKLSSTFHIYTYKDSYALKQTYWFFMETNYDGKLNPQLEESIDDVKWFDKDEIKSLVTKETYHTIVDVITEAVGF